MKKTLLLCCLFFLTNFLSINALEVKFERATLPVLVSEAGNHVGYFTILKSHTEKDYLNEISFSLSGTTQWKDVQNLSFYRCDQQGRIYKEKLLATTDITAPEGCVKVICPLTSDTCHIAYTVRLKNQVALNSRINVNCTKLRFDSGEHVNKNPFQEGLRVGIALRKQAQDGVHTSRIPGLTTSKNGTLLAIYDARWESGRDLQGDVDIALNRSTDRGNTWQPMQRVLDQHEWGNLPEKYNGVSDACILCDERTGDLYVAGLWMHGVLDNKTGEWIEGLTKDSTRWIHQWIDKGSQPGTDVKQTCQFLIAKSTDDGRTWSEPINITKMAKNPEWWLYAPAPGHGITLKDGTLVFPSQGRDKTGLPFSNITYSKDGGKTWSASNPAYHNTTECMAVQLENGDIMLNMRDNRNRGVASPNGRRICVTSDLGKTWKEHPTSHKVLTEPTCMASIHKHIYNKEKKSLLAFFNPNSYKARNQLTLKLSFDEGISWPSNYWIVLDEWGGAGYSCITSINENTLGIVYEGSGAHLIFQQINLPEIINK